MTDKELIDLISTKTHALNIRLYKKLDDNIKQLYINRYDDSDDIYETFYRLKHHIDNRPTCVICGDKVKFHNNNFNQTCLKNKCLSENNKRTVEQSFIKKYGTKNPWENEKNKK